LNRIYIEKLKMSRQILLVLLVAIAFQQGDSRPQSPVPTPGDDFYNIHSIEDSDEVDASSRKGNDIVPVDRQIFESAATSGKASCPDDQKIELEGGDFICQSSENTSTEKPSSKKRDRKAPG
jgi:hypothetical protein